MTKRKDAGDGPYSRLELAQHRVRVIAELLKAGIPLPDHLKLFIIDALRRIADGEDPDNVLGTKPGRGERRTVKAREARLKMTMALSWIAAQMQPPPEGRGWTLDEAIIRAAEYRPGEGNFGLSEETIRHIATHNSKLRKPNFPAPIEALAKKILPK